MLYKPISGQRHDMNCMDRAAAARRNNIAKKYSANAKT